MFTLSNIFKRGANYIFIVVLARAISVYDFGIYSVYANIIGILILVTNFGFSEYLLVNSNNKKLKHNNLNAFIFFSFSLFLMLFSGLLILNLENTTLAILILFKIFFDTTVYNILLSYFQVEKRLLEITRTNFFLATLLISASLYFYFNKTGVYALFSTVLAINTIIFSVLFYKTKFTSISLKKALHFVKEKFSELKFYGISTITVPIYMMSPTVIASFILNPETLAQYQVAFSIANILLLISVSQLQERYSSFLSSQESIWVLANKIKKTGFRIMIINISVLIFFILFGKYILLLIYNKEEYLAAFPLLITLLVSNVIFMVASVAATLMVVLKMQKEKSKYHLEFIFLSIFLGALMTYYYGSFGLTLSYALLYSYSAIRYSLKFKAIINKQLNN